MAFLEVKGISKKEGQQDILKDVSFIQPQFQKLAIAGETGSGKTSLLKIIGSAGEPDAGEVRFMGERVLNMNEKLLPGHKGMAYLSQYFELPKFLTVSQILSYANQIDEKKANQLYEVCRITHLLDRRTDQASGGERQRIALARQLSMSPKLLLLDEPFSNLDLIHKTVLKEVINDLADQLGITCLLVSHEPLDTLSWAEEMLILRNGQIVQKGTPQQLYRKPNDAYVCGLLGKYTLVQPSLLQAFYNVHVERPMYVRPEDFTIVTDDRKALEATISQILFYGSYYEIEAILTDGTKATIHSLSGIYHKGDTIRIVLERK